MNSKSGIEKCKDLKESLAMEDKNSDVRSDAGEPGKVDVRGDIDIKTNNNARKLQGTSNESDRGDTAADTKRDGKKGDKHKVKDSGNCISATTNESPIKKAEVDVNKILTSATDNSNLHEAKYNKIMASTNKIIQENIHLINTKAIPTNPKRVVALGNKETDVSHLDVKESKFKRPENTDNEREIANKEYKAPAGVSKTMTNTKSSNSTPRDVSKTVNYVKNKSLVIKIPKHISSCKLKEKSKMSNELNNIDPESPQSKFNNIQPRNASENCGLKTHTRDVLSHKNKSYWATKIQTAPKDLTKISRTLTNTDFKTETSKTDDFYMKNPTLHSTKGKHLKKKHNKKVKTPNKSSQTKLLTPITPMVADEHTKLYYEAWVNNVVTVSAQEEQPFKDRIQRLPSEPVKIPETLVSRAPVDYTDKRFTGTIKVKYGKNLK